MVNNILANIVNYKNKIIGNKRYDQILIVCFCTYEYKGEEWQDMGSKFSHIST